MGWRWRRISRRRSRCRAIDGMIVGRSGRADVRREMPCLLKEAGVAPRAEADLLPGDESFLHAVCRIGEGSLLR